MLPKEPSDKSRYNSIMGREKTQKALSLASQAIKESSRRFIFLDVQDSINRLLSWSRIDLSDCISCLITWKDWHVYNISICVYLCFCISSTTTFKAIIAVSEKVDNFVLLFLYIKLMDSVLLNMILMVVIDTFSQF